MLKTNITTKKYRKKLLTHFYGQCISLIIIIGVLLFLEISNGGGTKIIYLLLEGTLLFLFLGIKRILLLFDNYENESRLYQDSFEVLENVGLYIVDLEFNYLYMNKSNEKFMDQYYKLNPKVGENVSKYLADPHIELFKENVKAAISLGFHTSKDILNFEGRDIYLDTSYSPVRNSKGEIYAICCITTNITDAVQEKEKFTELIYQDPLTNLFNRRKIVDYYQNIQKEDRKVWFFVFDLDNFKNANDTYGHIAGDLVLVNFSDILATEFPQSAIVARTGGDEFCAIVPGDISYQKTIDFEELIKKRMNKIENYGVSVSIGKTFAGNTKERDLTYYLDLADKKMYKHKNSKKGFLSLV